jgi:hypothetical protein
MSSLDLAVPLQDLQHTANKGRSTGVREKERERAEQKPTKHSKLSREDRITVKARCFMASKLQLTLWRTKTHG